MFHERKSISEDRLNVGFMETTLGGGGDGDDDDDI